MNTLDKSYFGGSELPNLETLYVSGNPLTYIHNGTFQEFPALKSLEITHSKLEDKHINEDAFKGSQLRSLDLSYNNLQSVKKEWMDSMRNTLKSLTLRYNPIERLPSGFFLFCLFCRFFFMLVCNFCDFESP